jgi:hypothetical protein
MPSFTGFSDTQLTQVKSAYQTTRKTLQQIVTHELPGDSPSTKFRAQFKNWIGDIPARQDVHGEVKSAAAVLINTIKSMNAKVASLTFKVHYDATMGANAEMLSWRFDQGNIQDLEDDVSFCKKDDTTGLLVKDQRGGSPMTIGPAFFTLPARSLDQQSQAQSFMHELSHHAAGTIDDGDAANPCYGQQGVDRLKGLGPLRAVRNAENVAFFVVQFSS